MIDFDAHDVPRRVIRTAMWAGLLLVPLLASCSGITPAEPTYQQQVAECAKIPERSERQRCLDAVYRATEN